jgi:[FeFe] hydrogenase H-cluster maturation GTPase HydF
LGILLVVNNEWNTFEEQLVNKFAKNDLPYVIVHNKYDVRPISPNLQGILMALPQRPTVVEVSTKTGYGFDTLVEAIRKAIPESSWETPTLLGDIVGRGDVVMLITPIDSAAPAGRLILPQVQTIRDILDNHAISIVLKDTEVESFLSSTGIRPALVVTDSQIFDRAHSLIPSDVELTSFSILLARLKGDFENYIKGTPYISALVDNDRVLVLESCSHHVSCDDIGRVKIPNLMRKFTGKKLTFEVVPGLDKLPRSITDYALVVQCGGCVVTRKQLHNRLRHAVEAGVPVTNFGMAIAYMQGIFHRAIAPFVKEV